MDHRTVLPVGSALSFPGLDCRIDGCAGRGSNAIVYEASYQDATIGSRRHHILIKELFPFDLQGRVRRGEDGAIRWDADAEAFWQTHRLSFERGNDLHLQLLATRSGHLGGNLNTFPLNGTLYTLLDDGGGSSLERTLAGKPARDLRTAAEWCLGLLECLEIFHEQGYLHLDISPDNVLLTGGRPERVTLIDFNSAHSIREIQGGAALYFSAKEGFTAPEACTGFIREISFHTDLFSAAAVFYTLLLGHAPAPQQLTRKTPPDGQDSPLLAEAPSTVREQVKRILRRGLCALPERRYSACAAMRRDLEELLNRLDGLGVSHAALWEAGRRSVLRLVRHNPALGYLEREAELYPLRVTWEESGASLLLQDFITEVLASAGRPVLLEGVGGGGKSTALLRTVLTAPPAYSARNPAVIYLPLYEWKERDGHFILDQILRELRFDARTRTLAEARSALWALLGRPLPFEGGNRPVLLLLLDGLNEAAGDTAPLLREIQSMSGLPGLSIVMASRVCPRELPLRRARLDPLTDQDVDRALARHGLLLPESGEMRELLRTPLMLSLLIQTSQAQGTQIRCETEQQLVNAYLDALCAGTEQDGQQAYYQAEAAVRLVLPVLAREAQRQKGPLSDQRLLSPVLRCRRMLHTKTLLRVFPRWIGHGAEIAGDGLSGEAWYGRIVQDILWKRLGLLTRDEAGGWHIRHQILQERLARMCAVNRAAVRKARIRPVLLPAGLLACAVCVLCLLRPAGRWLAPGKDAVPAAPDMEIIAAAASRAYDPENPGYAHLMETLQAAEAGDVWQQYGMGILYEDGIGVEQDYEIARQYYLLAASRGQPDAFHRLGIFYEEGFGVETSMETAAAYYQKAADLGHTDAMIRLGELALAGALAGQSDTNAFHYFQQAWNNGDPSAAYLLGNLYRDGRGVRQSRAQAAQLYLRAAETGIAPAAEALGDLYSDESSGMADPEAAARYYRLADSLGSETARGKLDALEER